MDMAQEQQLPHRLTLDERRKLTVSGVTEGVSFDENTVILHTALGTLIIQGRELQLKALTLDGGNVAVDGQVGSLCYEEPRRGGWRGRLFG